MNEIINSPWFFVAIACVVVIALIFMALRQRRLEKHIMRLSRAVQISGRSIEKLDDSMEQRQERFRSAVDDRMDDLRDSNEMRFDQLRLDMTTRLDRRLGDSFRTVNDQLEKVERGLGEMRALARNVGDLKKIMVNPRARGAWGEVQLRAIMQEILSPNQYIENTPVVPGASERVEFAIVMPDPSGAQVLMAVDSKFPVEEYLRMEEGAGGAFVRRVLDEAKRISTKYIVPPHTVDYAVMFLPVESVYAEAARQTGLMERARNEYRVLIAGPGTFAALLTSLRQGYRGLAVERRGAEIMATLSGVREEFAKYANTVERARQRARQLETELDALDTRARAVERKLRDLSTDTDISDENGAV